MLRFSIIETFEKENLNTTLKKKKILPSSNILPDRPSVLKTAQAAVAVAPSVQVVPRVSRAPSRVEAAAARVEERLPATEAAGAAWGQLLGRGCTSDSLGRLAWGASAAVAGLPWGASPTSRPFGQLTVSRVQGATLMPSPKLTGDTHQ